MPTDLIVMAALIVLGLMVFYLVSMRVAKWIGRSVDEMWIKIVNIVVMVVVYALIFRGAHEEGHALAAYSMGIEGTVKFFWTTAHFYYPEGVAVTPSQEMWISLAGGLAVFAVYWVLVFLKELSLEKFSWDLDDVFTIQTMALWNLLYSFTEVIDWSLYGGLVSLVLALVIGLLLYGRRLKDWLRI